LEFHWPENRKVLIASLEWGMGHTTRSADIMFNLKKKNCYVIACGSEKQIDFWKKINAADEYLFLPGYEVKYYPYLSVTISVLLQLSKILHQIKTDTEWVTKAASVHTPELIISDNRYGFYHAKIPSVLVTHQTNPPFPFLRKKIVTYFKRNIYSRFHELWVPDVTDEKMRISGELSDSGGMKNVKYIGLLSLYNRYITKENTPVQEEDFNVWLLSGPTYAQKRFLNDLLEHHKKTSCENEVHIFGTIFFQPQSQKLYYHKNVSPENILKYLLRAKKIYARCGYSTLMDFIQLGIIHKTKFSPTPGQYEQLYLAKRLKALFPESSFYNPIRQ